MTFKRRYVIILAVNTLISILAMGIIPIFAYTHLSPREYGGTGLIASKPFHEELYGRLTGNDKIINNLPDKPKLNLVFTRDKGVVYTSNSSYIKGFSERNPIEELKQLSSLSFKIRAETFQYKDDFGIFIFEINRKSVVDIIRLYIVPFTMTLLIIFVIIPAIINFSLLFNLKQSFHKFEKAADKISKGDYELNLTRNTKDELFNFYQSFNRMANTLKENRDEKSRLLMSISHDLKTPLTSMKGYIEAFNDGLVSQDKAPKYYTIIKDKTMLLEDRINSLVDFAKLDTTSWIKTFQNIDIYPFILEISQAFKEDSIIYNREFKYAVDIPHETSIMGDPVLFMRAIENLLENAKRYTPTHGKIGLYASIKDETLVIEVNDNGKGIAPEDVENIFKPFYKVDKGRNSIGMGMGLYNVKTIIESHGGNIICQSKEGDGSRFIISISLS